MLGYPHVLVGWDVEPFGFVFQDLADCAAFDAILDSDVLLSGSWKVPVELANGPAVEVEEPLFTLLWFARINGRRKGGKGLGIGRDRVGRGGGNSAQSRRGRTVIGRRVLGVVPLRRERRIGRRWVRRLHWRTQWNAR